MKTGLYPEDAVVAYTALKLRKTLKWTAERSDEFLSGCMAAMCSRARRSRSTRMERSGVAYAFAGQRRPVGAMVRRGSSR